MPILRDGNEPQYSLIRSRGRRGWQELLETHPRAVGAKTCQYPVQGGGRNLHNLHCHGIGVQIDALDKLVRRLLAL